MNTWGHLGTHWPTVPYILFKDNFDQAFLLAQLVQNAGLAELGAVIASGDQLVERVAGMELAAFVALSERDKITLDGRITPDDDRDMAANMQRATRAAQLATTTMPQILLSFMVTIFEAYLEDLARLICVENPSLIEAAERGLARASGKGAPKERRVPPGIDERIHNLLAERWSWSIIGVFGQGFRLPIDDLCKAAATSPTGLDRIKVVRNLYTHSGGIIDERAIKRMGDPQYKVGQRFPLDYNFLVSAKDMLFFFGLGLDIVATAKYPPIIAASPKPVSAQGDK